MRLGEIEKAMQAGELGRTRQWAIEQQLRVGRFFDAQDFVEVAQVHIMADTESLGASGVEFLEEVARAPEAERRVRVPTITDPRGIDFDAYRRLRQTEWMADLERRAIDAFRALGVLMTDTCINYQIVMPPVLGQHLAFGDTGSTIYANSVQGARTNFEGGPSALAAALTGRTPRYGYHLPERRRATHAFRIEVQPHNWADWGALGGLIGRKLQSYWSVPLIEGFEARPTSDQLKHFGAALASYGTVALFHMPGITPEAPTRAAVVDGAGPSPVRVAADDLAAFYKGFDAPGDKLDVVVFSAPQLSLFELETLAALLDGKRVHPATTMLAITAPEIRASAVRHGLVQRIEASGAIVLGGVCFYQMHAREIGEANGWTRLMSNSAKLVNIIGGYGYKPTLATMERCIESAVAGRVL
ncbi:MAG: aconitase X catalytic domain-containing protein [Phreatobacter sp.]|uniref:aconitase X catalytic domain-containing protein n=1 Tax=Phreatobacter sp. TaxID=1966341 RepID=UPI001A37692E|nr:aconitase X catalytic domain-containing protein [Phreatobacter sp.]MBL8571846.1 aconitase X catalytic domain-containing protein [Phreatobacter sp.]